jgi:hypothetical protein
MIKYTAKLNDNNKSNSEGVQNYIKVIWPLLYWREVLFFLALCNSNLNSPRNLALQPCTVGSMFSNSQSFILRRPCLSPRHKDYIISI